jgi:alkanesulfonate monooxygenase SsuD/methylene tetrahydromethanopterin reductase-like flavin-dependent oxidoreductase (luciferase family)
LSRPIGRGDRACLTPLPERLVTNGEQGSLDAFKQRGSGKTLRELVVEASGGLAAPTELIGTPDQVADRMGAAMERSAATAS